MQRNTPPPHWINNNIFSICYNKVKRLFQRKPKKKKTKETGRSMVEVLAVLAIVGVLSAVGIMGYRYAMVKIETNNLVNELNTCSAIITTATIYHPDEDPDIDECLGGDLDKYDIEVSEIYTYEGETEKYFEFTLHHVSDEVLAELLHMDPPFISQIKVNGEVVEDGEVVSYHKPLFIKSAYAGGDNTVQIEVSVSGDAGGGNGDNGSGNSGNGNSGNNSDDDDDNLCKGKSDGNYCAGDLKYTCSNGREQSSSYCGYLKKCSNGSCVCESDSCDNPGMSRNSETCKCECPTGQYWDGDECTEEECDDVSDCEGESPCVYCSEGDHKCHNDTHDFCEGDWIRHCYDGKIDGASEHCNPDNNQTCSEGKCVCVDDDLCTPGEAYCSGNTRVFCSGGTCPHWAEQDDCEVCSEGHCCKTGESWVGDQCCPSARQCNGSCCPEGQECSNSHCCTSGESWFE